MLGEGRVGGNDESPLGTEDLCFNCREQNSVNISELESGTWASAEMTAFWDREQKSQVPHTWILDHRHSENESVLFSTAKFMVIYDTEIENQYSLPGSQCWGVQGCGVDPHSPGVGRAALCDRWWLWSRELFGQIIIRMFSKNFHSVLLDNRVYILRWGSAP